VVGFRLNRFYRSIIVNQLIFAIDYQKAKPLVRLWNWARTRPSSLLMCACLGPDHAILKSIARKFRGFEAWEKAIPSHCGGALAYWKPIPSALVWLHPGITSC
jgi:hypothetical protein